MSLKKIVFFAIIITSIFVINSFIRSIYNLGQKNDLVVKAKQELAKEKQENEELKKKLVIVKKSQFIEKEARNKLFLAKPGEGIIVIPTDTLGASDSSKPKNLDLRPNWQQWIEFFL